MISFPFKELLTVSNLFLFPIRILRIERVANRSRTESIFGMWFTGPAKSCGYWSRTVCSSRNAAFCKETQNEVCFYFHEYCVSQETPVVWKNTGYLSSDIESCLVSLQICSSIFSGLPGFSLSFLHMDMGDFLQKTLLKTCKYQWKWRRTCPLFSCPTTMTLPCVTTYNPPDRMAFPWITFSHHWGWLSPALVIAAR